LRARGQFRRGIGERAAAAEGAAVADRRVGDVRHRCRDERQVPRDVGGALELRVPRERADAYVIPGDFDPRKRRDAVDVDENFRRCDAEIQHRDEALSAREHPRLVLVLGKKRKRLCDARRSRVGKARCFHPPSSVPYYAALFFGRPPWTIGKPCRAAAYRARR